jgi:hypothetical protein
MATAAVEPVAAPPAPAAAADSSGWQWETEFHLVAPRLQELKLAHPFVDAESLRLFAAGRLLLAGEDYRLRAREGLLLPLQPLGAEDVREVLLIIHYRFRPFPVAPTRELHAVVPRPRRQESGGGPAALETGYGVAESATGDLTVRGSKSVRVASGSRRDLTVDQNLRLTIAGQLTQDIAVQAFLSDDNLPVVPEGNTEELRDVDKVLVQLQAPRWEATLGDFVAERRGTVFGGYRRKLQGASLTARPGRLGVDALAGSPRGSYRTLQIRGEESNQGPYRLGTGEVGDDIFIVAGSEKVTLDGERLTRGADRDYVIDYVRGTVTFTYRRLITAESTIVVEFEEGEGAYVRTVTGGGGAAAMQLPLVGGVPGELRVQLMREKDDPRRLRSGELDAADEEALAAAGDQANRAVVGGITPREPGEGSYRQVEIAGRLVFIYDPQNGDFDVDFFYTGAGQGDYGVDSLTVAGARVYGYRGEYQGSYLVGRPLPLPESHSLATVAARLGPEDRPYLQGEWNLSRQDLNELSDLDDGDNDGQAWVLTGETGERSLAWGERSLGRFSLRGRHEFRNARFRSFLLQRDLFSYDRWGLGTRARRPGFLEQRDAETNLTAVWAAGEARRSLRMSGEYDRLGHGDDLEADLKILAAGWSWHGGEGESRWEWAGSRDRVDPLDIQRRQWRHQVAWGLLGMRPAAFYEREQWEDAASAGTSATGFRLRHWGGSLAVQPGRPWRWQLGWERGLADSLRGDWRLERDSRTWRGEMATPRVAGMRLVADATWRRIRRPGGPESTTRLAKLELAGRWEHAGSDWSLAYGVDNSRTEVLDRQVVFVGERQGDYNESGDFVGRNLGDFNVVFAGTDSLVATTAVAADVSWRQDFGFLGRRHFWGAWSTLTQVGVKGRSRTSDVGGLLRLERERLLEDEDAVLGEVSLRQEANLLRNVRWLDARLRFDYDEARDRQYSAHPEDRLRRIWQGTVTWSPREWSSLQGRYETSEEVRNTGSSGLSSSRSYSSLTRRSQLEGSLRPGAGNRLALALEYITRQDAVSGVSQTEWALGPSIRYRLAQRWSAQAAIRWAEVTSEEPPGTIRPFFYSWPGRNVERSARLGWDPSDQLSVALVYFGRRLGDREWQHDVRLESTARF